MDIPYHVASAQIEKLKEGGGRTEGIHILQLLSSTHKRMPVVLCGNPT